MPNVMQSRVNLTRDTDRMLDELAEQAKVGRSEVVRQLIVVGEKLLRVPYADNELAVYHAIRAMRAQLGPESEYRKEYPDG